MDFDQQNFKEPFFCISFIIFNYQGGHPGWDHESRSCLLPLVILAFLSFKDVVYLILYT